MSSLDFGFWREGPHEIDLLVLRAGMPILALKCKAGRDPLPAATLAAFRKRFPAVPLMIVSLQDAGARRLDSGVDVLPWKSAIDRYLALK
ncbi:MAG: hypothetical protein HY748_17260 [Elusimicrobia bacterium]|nr:hypothetical protein [Elusimicrobiota bacterium]